MNKDITSKLNKLKRQHYTCEDPWFSCPMSEEGCINDEAGEDCNCGALESNLIINYIISELESQRNGEICKTCRLDGDYQYGEGMCDFCIHSTQLQDNFSPKSEVTR